MDMLDRYRDMTQIAISRTWCYETAIYYFSPSRNRRVSISRYGGRCVGRRASPFSPVDLAVRLVPRCLCSVLRSARPKIHDHDPSRSPSSSRGRGGAVFACSFCAAQTLLRRPLCWLNRLGYQLIRGEGDRRTRPLLRRRMLLVSRRLRRSRGRRIS